MTSSPTCCRKGLRTPCGASASAGQAAVARPLAPKPRASSVSWSTSRRDQAAPPGTRMPLIVPPLSAALRKTPKPEAPSSSVTSTQLEAEAQVRAVGAVAGHRLGVGQPGEGPEEEALLREALGDLEVQVLDRAGHVRLGRRRTSPGRAG